MAIDFKNRTEEKFAAYLDARALRWEYERELDGRYPDFSVDTAAGPVICEVQQFAEPENLGSGAMDQYGYIRRAIREKSDQGAGAKGRYPYVLVLGRDGFGPGPLDPINLIGAMYGNLGMSWTIDTQTGEATDDPPRPAVLGGGRTQPALNTRFSALVVVRGFNPTKRAFDEEWRRLRPKDISDVETAWRAADKALRRVRAEGFRGAIRRLLRLPVYRENAREQRLDTYHNVHATVPLPYDVFGGPHDDQYGGIDSHYTLVAQGLRRPEVPE